MDGRAASVMGSKEMHFCRKCWAWLPAPGVQGGRAFTRKGPADAGGGAWAWLPCANGA